mmetsp:Transcript_106865/g.189919  ORF Transcript_106865/g.189919 Transcript_106865/m.189919 type:complete len:231 (-) Transcript_106865:110-802(-)
MEAAPTIRNHQQRRVCLLLLIGASFCQQVAFLPGVSFPCSSSHRRALLLGAASSLLTPFPEVQATENRKGVSPEAGLKYEVVREGICEEAQDGDLVRAKHKFWLGGFDEDNPLRLTEYAREEVGQFQNPTKWKLGKKSPMNKWEPPVITDAIRGMRVEEIRRFAVPPEYAFGQYGRKVDLQWRRVQTYATQNYFIAADIPPNSTLYYEVELVWNGRSQLSGCIQPYRGDS